MSSDPDPWLAEPHVDWGGRHIVPGARGKLETMVRVYCPVCGEAWFIRRSHLRNRIRAGAFVTHCPRHRQRSPGRGRSPVPAGRS
jgi:predicted RNA-binding Zn-ribbon protein involved in translation (DUF1610 family)